ncbi:hypothetical protein A2783_01465 [Microgenomates group bacterium RIFCSPHIGHO2_01_FULL_45_11]|nr:MAG: hypothetical protein A2783_01465 [Microgenomates group bacterium RIFCSPHIGHO2_01_FULL_45_11]
MNPDWFLVLAVLIGFAFVVWFIQQKINSLLNAKQDTTLIEWAKQTQQDIKSLQQEVSKVLLSTNKDLTATLQQSYGDLHKRLDKAAILIGDLKKEAGQFSEISRSMRDLQEFLTSPKLRGNIGEHVLKDLISQTFPKQAFHLQYQFKSGMKVDAAIKTDAGILPIDSKFPMENFKRMVGGETQADRVAAVKEFARDVKKHIDDISKKYILPEEGTMDFALMYVPSEPVFYEIVNRPALMDYARGVRVYIVSPSTLYAHLQAILLGFEGKRIETKGREVLALLRAVQKDYEKVEGNLGVLGKHVTNTYNQMANVTGSFQLLGQKLASSQRLPAAEDSLKLGE